MKIAGAVAYDYKQSINDSSLLKIALEYTKTFGGRIISFSQDEFFQKWSNQRGNSQYSTWIKRCASNIRINSIFRDIEILEYSNGKVTFIC